ncbi:1082_t:CDS:2, partial [Dentiscutata heterogama]
NWKIYVSITHIPSISSLHPLYLSVQRNGETIIEFLRFETLCAMYNDTKHIKNLVHCVDINGNFDLPMREKDGACRILIQPVGYHYYPTDEKEWKSCLRTVLEVLHDMHKVGWTHRDIHWGNIMKHDSNCTKKRDKDSNEMKKQGLYNDVGQDNIVSVAKRNDNDDEWLIIDLEMGGRVNEVLDLTLWDRWPEKAEKGQIYKACYDVWQIERMLHEVGDNEFKTFSKYFWKFRNLLRRAAIDEISAAEALRCEWFVIDNEFIW